MCSNTFLPRAFARLGAFYFAPLASPPHLTFAVSPCLTWKTRRNWITGNDDLRTNGLSGDGISRRRGEAPRERASERERKKKKERQARRREMLLSIERAFDRFVVSHGVSLQETFVPLRAPCRGARGRKLSYDVTATPPESRSIWKRGETRRRPRNLHHHSRHPLRLQELSSHRVPARRGSPSLWEIRLFFRISRALCTGPTSRIVC